MAYLFTVITGVGLSNLAQTVTHSLGITPANLNAYVSIHQVLMTGTNSVQVQTCATGFDIQCDRSLAEQFDEVDRVNCWKTVRASMATTQPGRANVNAENIEDSAISIQAARTAEGSTTIPPGSRAQASSKRTASVSDDDIVSARAKAREARRKPLSRKTLQINTNTVTCSTNGTATLVKEASLVA